MSGSAHHGLARLRGARGPADESGVAQYRYGLVLILVVCAVVLAIGAPDGNASRAAVFAIVGAALLVAIATSRERTVVLRRRALLGGTVIVVITVLTAVGALAHWVTLGVGAVYHPLPVGRHTLVQTIHSPILGDLQTTYHITVSPH